MRHKFTAARECVRVVFNIIGFCISYWGKRLLFNLKWGCEQRAVKNASSSRVWLLAVIVLAKNEALTTSCSTYIYINTALNNAPDLHFNVIYTCGRPEREVYLTFCSRVLTAIRKCLDIILMRHVCSDLKKKFIWGRYFCSLWWKINLLTVRINKHASGERSQKRSKVTFSRKRASSKHKRGKRDWIGLLFFCPQQSSLCFWQS